MKKLVFLWDEIIAACFGVKDSETPGQANQPVSEDLVGTVRLLRQKYRLEILIQPNDDQPAALEAALQQQGLVGYFDGIHTAPPGRSGDKNAVDFPEAAERLGLPPGEIGLVSGSFSGGVIDANLAGLKTVWISPDGAAVPGHIPIQNVEAVSLQALPGALMDQLSLPDIQTCRAWYQREFFSAALWMHAQMVAMTAYQLAVWLRTAGEMVDTLLTQRGALLHDLAKLSARQSALSGDPISHGELAAHRLEGYGQPVLAEIARRHMLFCVLEEETKPQTWEQTLVYYADKLVEGAQITGYQVRLAALQARYPGIEARLAQTRAHIEAMQSSICRILDCNSDRLMAQLRAAANGTES